jgi:hypothetical protein
MVSTVHERNVHRAVVLEVLYEGTNADTVGARRLSRWSTRR